MVTRRINPIRFKYCLGDTNLEGVTSFVDLGIIIQDNLLWDLQINSMIKRANRNLWFIKRTVGPIKAKKLLYLTLVRSILEYRFIIWCPITKINMRHIESVQRRATKLITGNLYASYADRLVQCDLIPLTFRCEMLDCSFMYKARAWILGNTIMLLCDMRPFRQNPRLDPLGT